MKMEIWCDLIPICDENEKLCVLIVICDQNVELCILITICDGNKNLFPLDMTQSQAQTENPSCTWQASQTGVWYCSSSMTVEMCVSSCQKYGFSLAGFSLYI